MKIPFLIIAILSFFSTSSSQGIVLEYDLNHLNEMYPSKILTCKDRVIELTAPDDNNPENCYLWQPVPDQFKYQRTITVEPQITTDYSVQITNYTTGENHTYFITVYVIDHIELYELNNIQECMERRSLVIKGELIGERMNEISYSDTKKAFIHFRRLINNNFYPDHKWFPLVGGKFFNTLLALSPTEPFHIVDYYAVLKGPGLDCISNPVSIKVHRLWIEKFKDPESPQEHFVVVDRPIHHEALTSPDCTDFNWELKGSFKDWKLSNNKLVKSENMIIENNSLVNKNTQDFGPSHGIIIVSCKDETNQEYITTSDNLILPNNEIYTSGNAITRIMPYPFRSSVFYKKDEPHPKYNFFVPNWFVYWRQGVGIAIPFVNDVKFIDFNLPEFIDLKTKQVLGLYQRPIPPSMSEANTIFVTQLASEESSLPKDFELANIKITGIHNYFSTYTHELEHAKIFWENWPSGYHEPEDTDLDYYNDVWESNHKDFDFIVRQSGIIDTVDLYDPKNKDSNGYEYEEYRCFHEEEELLRRGLITKHDPLDWSFDPNFKFNGKQWK